MKGQTHYTILVRNEKRIWKRRVLIYYIPVGHIGKGDNPNMMDERLKFSTEISTVFT